MQQTFTSAPHHDVLLLLVQVALLLFAARAMGEIAQRFKQPAVVGEILAGVLLGPSVLSGLFPALGHWIVPQSTAQGHLLESISLLGAMFLLLITGLETDVGLIRRHARISLGASVGGIVVPFATGYFLGQALPDALLGDPDRRLVFSLFIATAMSISAIPVIAKVLMDLNLMRRDIGQAIIAAGMTDDAIGWMLLSVVLGLASSGQVQPESALWAVGKVVLFAALSFTVGRWLIAWALDVVQDRAISSMRVLSLVVVLTFAWGAITQALGLEAVFGAFVVGIIFAQMPRLPGSVRHDLERIALAVFAPIFFAVAGLKVNALALLNPRLLGITLVVIGVATLGKVVGGYVGARYLGGSTSWEALAFGAGMNARGAMEIIIASIGLRLGILSVDMFSIIVVMAITTSLMAPPALRWVLSHVQVGAEEEQRLKREELAQATMVGGIQRVLLPVQYRPGERRAVLTLEAHLVSRLAERGSLAATLFTVSRAREKAGAEEFLRRFSDRFPGVELTRRVVEGGDPTEAILDEMKKYYDLMILGVPDAEGDPEDLFSERVDYILRTSGCPTLVVRGRISELNWPPRRILVPADGSAASRNAADLAFLLAGDTGEVLLANVVETSRNPFHLDVQGTTEQRQLAAAREIVHQLHEVAQAHGVRTSERVEVDTDQERVLLGMAEEDQVDLIVLGTNLFTGSQRIYLGPQVERILAAAPCPVILLNTP